jgi:Protein of unknown function (DUF3592)
MEPLRVPNRGGSLWFVLGGILLCLFVVVAKVAHGSEGWVGLALIGALAMAVFAYALYGAKRSIDLGDEIVVRYFRRERVIPWSEVTFVNFDRTEADFGTGIPFVRIPTENHTMTLRLQDGGTLKADIEPRLIPYITEVLELRMTPDRERERNRREAEAATEWKRSRWSHVAMGLFFLIGGTWSVASMRERVFEASSSTGWPTAPATITQAHVVPKESTDRKGRKQTNYFPAVEYTYFVDGKSYTGTQFRFWALGSSNPDKWQELVSRFQTSQPPTIRYKPSDPSVSVVVAGADDFDVLFATGCGIAAIGGLAFAIINLVQLLDRKRGRDRKLVCG